MKKLILINSGLALLMGLVSVSAVMASVPKNVTDDTALYQNLSEIKVKRQAALNFDGDIARLSSLENKYREKLPQVRAPMERISKQKYHYTGAAVARK